MVTNSLFGMKINVVVVSAAVLVVVVVVAAAVIALESMFFSIW